MPTKTGNFDWAEPDDDVHAFVNDLERPAGTYLYGRKMYETMQGWQTFGTDPGASPVTRDFGELWRAADKVVYSTTLPAVSTPNTRLERAFDPAAVRDLKANSTRDITIGGPTLAAEAFRAGLVDECRLFLNPVIVGGGNPPSRLGSGWRCNSSTSAASRMASCTCGMPWRSARAPLSRSEPRSPESRSEWRPRSSCYQPTLFRRQSSRNSPIITSSCRTPSTSAACRSMPSRTNAHFS